MSSSLLSIGAPYCLPPPPHPALHTCPLPCHPPCLRAVRCSMAPHVLYLLLQSCRLPRCPPELGRGWSPRRVPPFPAQGPASPSPRAVLTSFWALMLWVSRTLQWTRQQSHSITSLVSVHHHGHCPNVTIGHRQPSLCLCSELTVLGSMWLASLHPAYLSMGVRGMQI